MNDQENRTIREKNCNTLFPLLAWTSLISFTTSPHSSVVVVPLPPLYGYTSFYTLVPYLEEDPYELYKLYLLACIP